MCLDSAILSCDRADLPIVSVGRGSIAQLVPELAACTAEIENAASTDYDSANPGAPLVFGLEFRERSAPPALGVSSARGATPPPR